MASTTLGMKSFLSTLSGTVIYRVLCVRKEDDLECPTDKNWITVKEVVVVVILVVAANMTVTHAVVLAIGASFRLGTVPVQ